MKRQLTGQWVDWSYLTEIRTYLELASVQLAPVADRKSRANEHN
jgi:hypothetical protein